MIRIYLTQLCEEAKGKKDQRNIDRLGQLLDNVERQMVFQQHPSSEGAFLQI